MRLVAPFFAMLLAGPAAAQQWTEYQSPDAAFTVHFPTDPNIETTTYRTPARGATARNSRASARVRLATETSCRSSHRSA